MRSFKSKDEFLKKMNKKPALQAAYDNASSYTDEEINALRGVPKWAKEALIKVKNRNGMSALEVAQRIAQIMIEKSTQT